MCVPRFFCQNNTFTLLVSPITSFNLWIPTCDQRVLLLSKAKRYWETLIWANSSDSCYFFSGTSSPSKRNLGNDLAVVALDVRCQNCGSKDIDTCNIYQHSVLKVVCNPEKGVGTMSGPWILLPKCWKHRQKASMFQSHLSRETSPICTKVQLWLNASVALQLTLSRCGKLNILSNWQRESRRFFFCAQAIDTLGTVWRSAASGFINKIRHCYEFLSSKTNEKEFNDTIRKMIGNQKKIKHYSGLPTNAGPWQIACRRGSVRFKHVL